MLWKISSGTNPSVTTRITNKKPASKDPWTRNLWIYDLRTNMHFTLRKSPLKRSDLDDFVQCYRPENRAARKETERFKRFSYKELMARDKTNLDIFWLRDEGLETLDDLAPPDVIATEIVESLEAALEQFRAVAEELNGF